MTYEMVEEYLKAEDGSDAIPGPALRQTSYLAVPFSVLKASASSCKNGFLSAYIRHCG
jgi:hypothetical protein